MAGAVFGVILMGLALAAAGGGHGTYVLLGLFSAPLGCFGISVAVFGTPLLWATVGVVAGLLNFSTGRRCLLGFLLIHYVSAACSLWLQYGNWDRTHGMWIVDRWMFIYPLTIYLVGQFALITSLVRHAFLLRGEPPRFQFSIRWMFWMITAFGVFLTIAVRTDLLSYIFEGVWWYVVCLLN